MLESIDTLNTLLQAFIINYFPYYCLKKDNNTESNKSYIYKLILGTIITAFLVVSITYKVTNATLSIIIITLVNMIVIGFANRTSYKKAILAYFIVYCFIQIYVILFSSVTFPIFKNIISNLDIAIIVGIYIPAIIGELALFVYRKKIYYIYANLKKNKYFFQLGILFVISLDYIICISMVNHGWGGILLTNITIFTLIAFVITIVYYINNINSKNEDITRLNNKLLEKNGELKKIKHDYGSQISYINGLYIMEQYDRMGELLTKIIEGNSSVGVHVKSISCESSVISSIINSIDTQDVHIVIDEEIDLNSLAISEYDLHKILSNIIKNALTAIDDNGLIFIKTYKIFNSVYVSVKNNGPQIDPEIIDSIFDLGFTTKSNEKEENGYGLYIVKELVEENNGKIYVNSTDLYTEFKLVFKDIKDKS